MHHDRLGGEEGVMGRGGYEKEKEREKGRRGEQATTHISPVQHRTDRCYRLITRSIAIRGAARKLPKAEHPRRLEEESLTLSALRGSCQALILFGGILNGCCLSRIRVSDILRSIQG